MAGSTSVSTPTTPSCARSTRRPDWTASSGVRSGSALRTASSRPGRVTSGRPSCTPCGSCTTRGWPPTHPSHGSSRWTVDGRRPVAPGGRRGVRAGADRADGAPGARPPPPGARQRLAAYALVLRDDAVLLTRNSARGPRPGRWTLPGGGVDHGEPPAAAVAREVRGGDRPDRSGGELLGVHDEHFTGTAPHGREEDFHGVALVFAATVAAGAPAVRDRDGTTDAVAWASAGGGRGGSSRSPRWSPPRSAWTPVGRFDP